MDQSTLSPNEERLLKRTLLEKLPTTVVGIPVGLNHRRMLTVNAFKRGQSAAAQAKPLMQRQSAALVEAEQIFGEIRIEGFIEAIEAKTQESESMVAHIRERAAAARAAKAARVL